MGWIGVECEASAGELSKWAAHIRVSGGPGGGMVADVLERMAGLVSGSRSGMNAGDRMREVEARAANAVERKRVEAVRKAGEMIGAAVGGGVEVRDVLCAIGVDGWRGGSSVGDKNGGAARKRRVYSRQGAAVGPSARSVVAGSNNGAGGKAGGGSADGIVADSGGSEAGVLAERPAAPPVDGTATITRDGRYGRSFEGWCANRLRDDGFKMRHVALGVDMTLAECWRYISGWQRHWKREGLCGRQFAGPEQGWQERYEECRERAQRTGRRGPPVVLNGMRTYDKGAL